MNLTTIKAYSGNDPYIFVSYAHKDSEIVLPIIASLQKKYNVWFDEGLHYGKEWDEEIIEKLKNCSMFIFMVTNASLCSQNCKDELEFAREKNKTFVNIYIQPNTETPEWFKFRFGRFHWCNLYTFSSCDEAIEDLSQKCDSLQKVEKQDINVSAGTTQEGLKSKRGNVQKQEVDSINNELIDSQIPSKKENPALIFRNLLESGNIKQAIDYCLNFDGNKRYKLELLSSAGYIFANCFWNSGPLYFVNSEIIKACMPFLNLEKALSLWVDVINYNSEVSDEYVFRITLRPLLKYIIKDAYSNEQLSRIVSCIVNAINNNVGLETINKKYKKELISFIQHLLKNNQEADAKSILTFWRLQGDPDATYIEAALMLKRQHKQDKDFYLSVLEIISCSKDNEHIPCVMLKAVCFLNLYAVTKEYKYKLTASDLFKKASDHGETCAMIWVVNDSFKSCNNSEQSIATLRKIVLLEYKGAKEALAICYLEGLSCTKDIVEAKSLLFKENVVDLDAVLEEIEELGGKISYSYMDILAKLYYIAKEGSLIEKNKAMRELKKICLYNEERLPQNILKCIKKTILNIHIKPYRYELFDCEIEIN